MKIFEKVMRKFGYAPVSTLGAAPDMLAALQDTKKLMAEMYVEDTGAKGIEVWVKVNRAIAAATKEQVMK